MKPLDKLSIRQAERRFDDLRKLAEKSKVKPGWIRYMRQVLCMTLSDLAKQIGLSTATVQQFEKRETQGDITLKSLQRLGNAMNCDFIYAFVPREGTEQFLRKRAISKATKLLNVANVHMELEDQRVAESAKERIENLAEQLLERGDLW